MTNNVIVRKWKNTGLVKVDNLSGITFTGESGAHTFRIQGIDADGQKQPIVGAVSGKFWNKNTGITTPLSGTIEDGEAVVTLDAPCYVYGGLFSLMLFATNGSTVSCIYCGVGKVEVSQSDTIAYPSAAIPDIVNLVNELQAIFNSWPADYTSLQSDVSSLKSAIGEDVYVLSNYNTGYYNLGSTITTLDIESAPTTSSGGSNFRCKIIPCSPGDVFKITSTGTSAARNWAFLSSASGASNIISRKTTSYTMSDEIVTAPSKAQYAVFNVDSRQTYLIIYGGSVSYKLDVLENGVLNSLDNANIQLNKETITARNLMSGYYWNTTTGKLAAASGWSCTTDFIAVPSDMIGKLFKSLVGAKVSIVCYDANKAYSGTFVAYASTPVDQMLCMPSGTVYIQMSVHTEVDQLSIGTINGATQIEYPYTDAGYLYKTNTWCDNTGVVETVDTMDCVCLPNVTAGDKWYTNATNSYVFMPFDNTNTFLGVLTPDQVNKHGRIYTVPANTAYVYCNIPHANTHGNYSTVFYNITNGGKVLAIGDSITWLDGETGGTYDSATLFLGWQKQLERIGFDVTSAGFNGYCYAKGVSGAGSIYTKIVEEQYDVSGYDYIVLAGGTNDDSNNVAVGTVPTEYQHTYTASEVETTAGALGAIISYIRTNNTSAKIILCTQHKSQANSRPYSEAVTYADMIRQMSKYASCKLCDLFSNMNVTPFTSGFTALYYDVTHPNRTGMERMGKLIADAVASYE